jgi:hypothetical protein
MEKIWAKLISGHAVFGFDSWLIFILERLNPGTTCLWKGEQYDEQQYEKSRDGRHLPRNIIWNRA